MIYNNHIRIYTRTQGHNNDTNIITLFIVHNILFILCIDVHCMKIEQNDQFHTNKKLICTRDMKVLAQNNYTILKRYRLNTVP